MDFLCLISWKKQIQKEVWKLLATSKSNRETNREVSKNGWKRPKHIQRLGYISRVLKRVLHLQKLFQGHHVNLWYKNDVILTKSNLNWSKRCSYWKGEALSFILIDTKTINMNYGTNYNIQQQCLPCNMGIKHKGYSPVHLSLLVLYHFENINMWLCHSRWSGWRFFRQELSIINKTTYFGLN